LRAPAFTCLECPHVVSRCRVSLRSCSMSRDGAGDSCLMVECLRRPELGLFEPLKEVECSARGEEAPRGSPI